MQVKHEDPYAVELQHLSPGMAAAQGAKLGDAPPRLRECWEPKLSAQYVAALKPISKDLP